MPAQFAWDEGMVEDALVRLRRLFLGIRSLPGRTGFEWARSGNEYAIIRSRGEAQSVENAC